MNNLIALLIRQALAACGGFFAANNITGDSTTSIVIGLIMLLIPTLWSWVAKVIHLEDESQWGAIGNNEILRTLIGAIVSQGVTALSVYFATDANNPELLGVAVINAAAAKWGVHQKLARIGSKDALKILLVSLSPCLLVFSTSCSSFTKDDAINYGERVGLAAADTAIFLAHMQLASAEADLTAAMSQPGANKSEIIMKRLAVATAQQALHAATRAVEKRRGQIDAKQPLRTVSPEPTAPVSAAVPACLKLTPRVIVPRYGVEVAEALQLTH